jgi:hypothetical protein
LERFNQIDNTPLCAAFHRLLVVEISRYHQLAVSVDMRMPGWVDLSSTKRKQSRHAAACPRKTLPHEVTPVKFGTTLLAKIARGMTLHLEFGDYVTPTETISTKSFQE